MSDNLRDKLFGTFLKAVSINYWVTKKVPVTYSSIHIHSLNTK